ERHADARLQDPVSRRDPADRWIERRPVQGMRDDADQLARRVAGRTGIAVEGDAVADLRQNGRVADGEDEAGVGGATQQAVELLDLSALALPPHPQALLVVPLTRAMEEKKPVRAAAVLGVQRSDAVGRRREDRRRERARLSIRVPAVTE